MILRLTTIHENSACRAGACPGLADASVGPTICAAVIFKAAKGLAVVFFVKLLGRFSRDYGISVTPYARRVSPICVTRQ